MNRPVRPRLRRLRFALQAAFAGAIIALGVLAGLTQLAMPWLVRHPAVVEDWLSARLGRDVAIGRLQGAWIGGGPVLALDEVRIGADPRGQGALAVPHAELAFDLFALFRSERALTEFRIGGLEVQLANEGGSWHVRGFDPALAGSSGTPSLGALGALELRNLRVVVDDAGRGLHVELAAPVLRLVNRGASTRVLGRVHLGGTDAPLLDVVADIDAASRSGTLYAGAGDVDLAHASMPSWPGWPLLAGGTGSLQAWLQVRDARIEDVRARVDLAGARFTTPAAIALDPATTVAPRAAIERLAFAARWQRAATGWRFDLADFATTAGTGGARGWAQLQSQPGSGGPQWQLAASALPLQPAGDLAMLAPALPDGLRRWLYLARPHGQLATARLRCKGKDDFALDAEVDGFGVASAAFAPGVESLDAHVSGDAQSLLLRIPAQALRVDYPAVFRRPFRFARLGGEIAAWRTQAGWRLETDRIGFEGEGYGGELRGGLDLEPGRRPVADLYAAVRHGDVVAAKLFWPTNVMPPAAVEWLDRALVGGRVTSGRATLHGDLADWPFHDHSGVMLARAAISDATLDYHPDWPAAQQLEAVATFVNDGMQAEAATARSLDVAVSAASARIADFSEPVLELAAQAEGSAPALLAFVRASPIGKRYEEYLRELVIRGGKGDATVSLTLPIGTPEDFTLTGAVALSKARLDHERYDLHFTDATGPLRFNQGGFLADALDVGYRDGHARLSLAIGSTVADPRHVLEGALDGNFPASAVFAGAPVLAPLAGRLPGTSDWHARVTVDADDNHRSRLLISSDLAGTAIDLPAPLAKPAAASLPFQLALELPYAGQPFSLRLGDILSLAGHLPDAANPLAASLVLGSASAVPVPASGIRIAGDVPVLDAAGWIGLAGPVGSGGAGLLQGIDLHVGDLLLAGRHFDQVHLALDPSATATTLQLDSAALAGTLRMPAGGAITADFTRIHWPDLPEGEDTGPGAFAGVDPAAVPPLHMTVGDLRLGSASLGAVAFDSQPVAGGMRIDRFSARSPNVTISASGEWTGPARASRSRLGIALQAKDLGRMLDAFGFAGLIEGGDTRATIDASWPGPPSTFELARLDGTLKVEVGEGRILEVEPGAGRIFGLLSLTEIPRRLSLDFSDFFRSGLAFNAITGAFRLEHGNAYTDDLTIRSPAADIVVTGRTGLRAKDYDQQMRVTPHAGATLPIVGALAAGPVGAAAGLVIQGILNKPIGKAVVRRYEVKGSWDKPEIRWIPRDAPAAGDGAGPGDEDRGAGKGGA